MASPLDELVKQFVDPVMKDGGFERLRAREWWISSLEGHAVFLQMRPYIPEPVVKFHVEAAVVPGVLWDYHGRSSSSKPVEFDWGLIRASLSAPEGLEGERLPRTHLWGVRLDHVDIDGLKLCDYFREFVVPRWKSLLSPEVLAQAAYGGPQEDFWVMLGYGPNFGKLILDIDDGDPHQLENMIDELISTGADQDLLEWLRQRLHARVLRRS